MSSPRLLVSGAIAALAIGACSGETSIVLRVTRDDSVAAVPRVHVAIGVRAPADVVAPATGDPATQTITTYVDDVAAGDLVDTSAIDLAAAPYELELRPSAGFAMGDGLELAAVGYDGDGDARKAIAFGAIGHEVHFHAGETFVYEIALAKIDAITADARRHECGALSGSFGTAFGCKAGCVRFGAGADAAWIGAHDDIDCDGDPHEADCDDYDWTVNHLATDVCGNGKNDDCAGGVDDGVDRDGDGFTPC